MNTTTIPRTSVRHKSQPKPTSSYLSPSGIADLIPMPELLRELGFHVNQRTRRCACFLHGGKNPSAFSWIESGQWFCHSCNLGGDRIELMKRVRGCDFKDALRFIAQLAGVDIANHRPTFSQLEEHRQKEAGLDVATEKLRLLEGHLRARYREEIFDLERIKKLASGILKAKHEREKCDRESEWAWSAIELVNNWLPRVAAGYSILAFANAEDRAKLTLHPEGADNIIQATIERGYFTDDWGHIVEVLA